MEVGSFIDTNKPISSIGFLDGNLLLLPPRCASTFTCGATNTTSAAKRQMTVAYDFTILPELHDNVDGETKSGNGNDAAQYEGHGHVPDSVDALELQIFPPLSPQPRLMLDVFGLPDVLQHIHHATQESKELDRQQPKQIEHHQERRSFPRHHRCDKHEWQTPTQEWLQGIEVELWGS